jgi:hypothetical protein
VGVYWYMMMGASDAHILFMQYVHCYRNFEILEPNDTLYAKKKSGNTILWLLPAAYQCTSEGKYVVISGGRKQSWLYQFALLHNVLSYRVPLPISKSRSSISRKNYVCFSLFDIKSRDSRWRGVVFRSNNTFSMNRSQARIHNRHSKQSVYIPYT